MSLTTDRLKSFLFHCSLSYVLHWQIMCMDNFDSGLDNFNFNVDSNRHKKINALLYVCIYMCVCDNLAFLCFFKFLYLCLYGDLFMYN